jgi:hypothetical protein
MKWLLIRLSVYGFGIVIIMFFMSPFIANFAVDWSTPVSAERKDYDTKDYIEQYNAWQEKKSKLMTSLNSLSEEKVSAELEKFKTNNPEPKNYYFEVKWEDDEYSFLNKPAFLAKKIFHLPWFPNTIWVMIAYVFLLKCWFMSYKKSGLWFQNSGLSHINKFGVLIALIGSVFLALSIYLTYSRQLNFVSQDSELVGYVKSKQLDCLSSLPLVTFVMTVLTALYSFIFCDIVVHIWSEKAEALKRFYHFICGIIFGFFEGTKISIGKDSVVRVSKRRLKFKWFLPYLSNQKYRMPLNEFLVIIKSLFLSNVTTGQFKRYEDLFMNELRSSFLEMHNNSQLIGGGEALPKNLRFLVEKGDKTIAILVEEPKVRRISFAQMVIDHEAEILMGKGELDNYDDDLLHRTSFDLAFPYVVLVGVFKQNQFHELYAFWSPTDINSLSDEIYQFPLPNIGGSGHVCLGYEGRSSNFSKTCNEVSEYFWQAGFSYHMVDAFNSAKFNNKMSTLFEWHLESQKNPRFICGVRMLQSGNARISKLLEKIESESGKSKAAKLFDNFLDDLFESRPISLEKLKSSLDFDANAEQIFSLVERRLS